jgi:hypothetical protein
VVTRIPSKDKRHWPRLPLAIPVFARGVDDRGKEFAEFTTALNVGAGGLLLVVRRYLAPSSPISIEIPSAPLPQQATAESIVRALPGRVVHVKSSDRCYLCGVQFTRPLILPESSDYNRD